MIHEYSPFFIKRSFDLPEYTKKIVKKKPILKDYLFYSFFSKINNLDITNSSFETYNEKKEKTLLAEKIDKLKFKHKDFIMNNLMYDTTIHLMTLDILCKYYKIDLFYIKNQNHVFIPMIGDGAKLAMNDKFEFIPYDSNIFNTHYEILHLDKPLFSVSYYKVADLVEICKKLHLPFEGFKKQILYDSIHTTLVNLNIYKID